MGSSDLASYTEELLAEARAIRQTSEMRLARFGLENRPVSTLDTIAANSISADPLHEPMQYEHMAQSSTASARRPQ